MKTLTLAGQVLLPNGAFSKATVRVQGSEITSVDAGADARADFRARGWIVPGFIDLQVNGAFGLDITADPSSALALAEKLPQTGVTSFLPTIITAPIESYGSKLRVLDESTHATEGANILGVHLEGPYLSPHRVGAHNPDSLRLPSIAEFEQVLYSPCVRLVTLAPELPGALNFIRHLRSREVVVSAGHSEASYEQAQVGFEAGVTMGTHLFNAMSPWTPRAPGLAGALLASEIPCGLIVDGIHTHPATVDIAWRTKGAHGLVIVTDAMAAMGMPAGRYILGDREVLVDGESARLADGTLAGSVLQMDAAIRNFIQFTGASLADAVTAASVTPAHVLGLKRGQIAPGYDADVVVLDESLHIEMTIVGGRVVYQRG